MDHDVITQAFLEPLCDSTRKLLRPVSLQLNDYLEIDIDKEGKRFILNFYALIKDWSNPTELKRRGPSWSVRHFVKRIPERKQVQSEHLCETYVVGGTDFSAIIIHSLWPKDRLEFRTDEAKFFFEFLLTRFFSQTEKAKIKASYKINKELPEMPEDFIDHPIRPLMSFQKVAVAASVSNDDNLWMEQGTGKTPIIISRICYEAHRVYKKEKRMYSALIIVPNCVRMNWHNKFIDFAVHSGKLTVLRGCQLTRIKLLVEAFKTEENCEYTVVIGSYDTIINSWAAIRMIEWDFCGIDEAHMIKSPTTKRWKILKELRDLSKNRAGLTGTPIANNLFDAWTQLEWLGEGLSGFMTFKGFKSYYGKFVKSQDGQRDILNGYNNLPILQERFTRLCFMITRAEAMPELPKKTYDIYEVEMSKQQREFYTQLQTQLAIEIEAELKSDTNKQLTANHILTKLLRLSQITSGYLKWDDQVTTEGEIEVGKIEYIKVNPKLEALIEILKNKRPEEKTIVWTNWVPAIKFISQRLLEEKIEHVVYYGGTSEKDRIEAERRYNQEASCRVWLSNPTAGGVGLDLWGHIPEWVGTSKDHGCNTTQEIYYSQDWSMIKRTQSEDRAVRRGTRVSVQITDLIIPKTIDEEIACRVLDKKMTAMQLQDVRSIFQRIINNISILGETNEQ